LPTRFSAPPARPTRGAGLAGEGLARIPARDRSGVTRARHVAALRGSIPVQNVRCWLTRFAGTPAISDAAFHRWASRGARSPRVSADPVGRFAWTNRFVAPTTAKNANLRTDTPR
jgi:hypothetical protein